MSAHEGTRREFLLAGGAAAIAAAVRPGEGAEPVKEIMERGIIDCHAHIYSDDEVTYPVIEKPYRPPAGKGTVAHLRKEIQAAGVRSVAAIHTFTFYGWDNRFMLEACREQGDILAGVCLLNPDDPQSVGVLERGVKEHHIRGLRIFNHQKSGKLDEPGNDALVAAAQRLGVTVCVLTNHDSRPQIEALAKRYPQTPLVIDHALNLVAGKNEVATMTALLALAELPNVHVKLSHVVTGSAEGYPFRDMHESCRRILAAYGAERCVWGSDFPCELWCPKATYAQHLRVFTHELGFDAATQRQILCDTPRRLGFGATGG